MPIQVDFAAIFQQLKQGIIGLAESTVKKFVKEAKDDGLQILHDMKEKLERWTKMLIAGQLTTEDFEFLVNSQKDLIAMNALKEVGLAAIRIDQFKSSVMNLIVDSVFNIIKI
jgi:hypothetical protein